MNISKTVRTGALIASIAATGLLLWPGACITAQSAQAKATALVCPVSGNKIASPGAAAGHETYKGKTYYFCCPMCQPKFDKNRDQIIKNAAKGIYQGM